MELPSLVRAKALALGDEGQRWIERLPATIAALEGAWDVAVGRQLPGGSAGFVAEATARDGRPLVLKIAIPDGSGAFDRSVEALRRAGPGSVRLIAHDRKRAALLLERLGPSLASLNWPVERQLEAIATTLRDFWVPIPEPSRVPTGADQATWLADFVPRTWEELGRPCERRTIDAAVDFAHQRGAALDRTTAVLVHGDAHRWNTLQAPDGSFRLVDPEGLISEPAHDLGIAMREIAAELLAGDAVKLGRTWANVLGEVASADAEAIWQWAFVERVSTGLYLLQLGSDEGRGYLNVADVWSHA